MSTKEEPGPFDGLERAAPGEPVFPLRAKDPLAARLVRVWAWQRRRAVVRDRSLDDDKRTIELVQCREAEAVADAMDDWRNGVVAAAEPEKPAPTYTGSTMGADELAAKQRFDTVRNAADRLNNAVAEIADAAEALGDTDASNADVVRKLLNLSHEVKVIAEQVRPKRASYAHRVAA